MLITINQKQTAYTLNIPHTQKHILPCMLLSENQKQKLLWGLSEETSWSQTFLQKLLWYSTKTRKITEHALEKAIASNLSADKFYSQILCTWPEQSSFPFSRALLFTVKMHGSWKKLEHTEKMLLRNNGIRLCPVVKCKLNIRNQWTLDSW